LFTNTQFSMPLEGHPADCACCTVRLERAGPGRKRAREDADLGTFLPEEPAPAPAPAPAAAAAAQLRWQEEPLLPQKALLHVAIEAIEARWIWKFP
jgi:hypothetical protein